MQLLVWWLLHPFQIILLGFQQLIQRCAFPKGLCRVIVQMNFHSESQRCGFVALSIGLPRPKAVLRVVDKLRPMLLYHLLAVFQAVRKGDDKPVSTPCQELQILLAVKSPVHDETSAFPIDKLVVRNHIFQVRLVRYAPRIHPVVQRKAGFFSVVHSHVDLGKTLLVPVVPPLHLSDVLAVGGNAGHIIGHILCLLFVFHPLPEEQLHVLLPQRGEGLAALFVAHPSLSCRLVALGVLIQVVHHVSLTQNILSCRQHFFGIFREVLPQQRCYTQFFTHLFKHVRYPKVLNPSCHRHGLFQIGLIVVPVRNQLPRFLIQTPDGYALIGRLTLFIPIGRRHIIHVGLSGNLLVGNPMLG